MKVGGFSVIEMIARDIYPDARQRYPAPADGDPIIVGTHYDQLLRAKRERGAEIRLYTGHFPYAAAAHLAPVKTLAVFRDPVDRVCSHIRHFIHYVPLYEGWSAERVYEDAGTRRMFFDNLQLRMFAIRSLEQGKTAFDGIELRESDIEYAMKNVRRVDVIGVTEELKTFIRILGVQFGWQFRRMEHVNYSPEYEFSPEFIDRVRADLKLDIEFYRRVRSLYTERKRALIAQCGGSLPLNIKEKGVRL